MVEEPRGFVVAVVPFVVVGFAVSLAASVAGTAGLAPNRLEEAGAVEVKVGAVDEVVVVAGAVVVASVLAPKRDDVGFDSVVAGLGVAPNRPPPEVAVEAGAAVIAVTAGLVPNRPEEGAAAAVEPVVAVVVAVVAGLAPNKVEEAGAVPKAPGVPAAVDTAGVAGLAPKRVLPEAGVVDAAASGLLWEAVFRMPPPPKRFPAAGALVAEAGFAPPNRPPPEAVVVWPAAPPKIPVVAGAALVAAG